MREKNGSYHAHYQWRLAVFIWRIIIIIRCSVPWERIKSPKRRDLVQKILVSSTLSRSLVSEKRDFDVTITNRALKPSPWIRSLVQVSITPFIWPIVGFAGPIKGLIERGLILLEGSLLALGPLTFALFEFSHLYVRSSFRRSLCPD